MATSPPPEAPMPPAEPRRPWVTAAAVGLVVAAGAACYANGLGGAFVFDDLESIPENPSIRGLGTSWNPPAGTTVAGRPLLNVSLALNYAAGGLDVRGYHLVNLAVHLAAAAVLFALVRGTMLLPVAAAVRARATGVALAVALLWVVHPLGTEAVSYVVQRCEAMAALFTLLTLYGLLRGSLWAEQATGPAADAAAFAAQTRAADRAGLAYAGAVLACALGVLSKETAVAAPVVALLYDRAFLAGSFAAALRRRRWLYAALFSTWVLAGALAWEAGGRGASAGLGSGVSPRDYAAAQPRWVLHYLRLAVWPDPLAFDYGAAVTPAAAGPTAAVLALLGLTAVLYWSRPAVGFPVATVIVLLAPSSSVIPVATQVAAERRMYLPLAGVVVTAVLAVVWGAAAIPAGTASRRRLLGGLLVACAVPLAVLTHLRNRQYRTPEALWADAARTVPDNPRPRANLGHALLEVGRPGEAAEHLRAAVSLAPDDPRPRNLLGFALVAAGDRGAAVEAFREVVRLDPGNPEAEANLGGALLAAGNPGEAVGWYQKAVAARPGYAEAHAGLGQALRAAGRPREAAESFRAAAALDPRFARPPGP